MINDKLTPDFYAGLYTGVIQNIVGHPLDTMKVILQNNKKLKNLKFPELYRGFSYPLYKLVLTGGMSFDIRSKMKNNGQNNDYLNGAITGASISPFVHVFDVFKIKKQNNMKYSMRDFIKPQSILLSVSRETIGNSVYLGSYFGMRENEISPLLAGGIAGCLNWSSTYMIDSIKTRYITYDKTIKQCILMGNYWKGFRICMIRAFLVNSIGFQVYELSLKYIKDFSN